MYPFGISNLPPPQGQSARFASGRTAGDRPKNIGLSVAIWILVLTLARKLSLRILTNQPPQWDECTYATLEERLPSWVKES